MAVYQLAKYPISRDYVRLAELAKEVSVICVVEEDGIVGVAQTIYSRYDELESWNVSVPGKAYVSAPTIEAFVRCCERVKLAYLVPPVG